MLPKIVLQQSPRTQNILDQFGFFNIAGFELYRGVILAYDCDVDHRLRQAVDHMRYFFHNLLFIHEQDGALLMIWKNHVPDLFQVGQSIPTSYPDQSIDHWYITTSTIVKGKMRKNIEKHFELMTCFLKLNLN